jgi:hypothetical protein
LVRKDNVEIKKFVRNTLKAAGKTTGSFAGTNPASNEAKKLIKNDGTNRT